MNPLYCPKCQGKHTSHGLPVVYMRLEDDYLVEVEADGEIYRFPNHLSNNPSPRRGAVVIPIKCEVCGPVGALNIVQHKGETMVYFNGDKPIQAPGNLLA